MVKCQKCGASVSEEQAFCQNCGSAMDAGRASTRQDASWDMASTVVGQKIPPMTATPAKPAGNVAPPPPAKPAGSVPPPSHNTASPPPPATRASAPPPAPAAAASSRTGIYIGMAVIGGLLLVILLLVLLR